MDLALNPNYNDLILYFIKLTIFNFWGRLSNGLVALV